MVPPASQIPRFVPTLTEVVPKQAQATAVLSVDTHAASTIGPVVGAGGSSVVMTTGLEDQIAQRVLERVDAMLELRLAAALEMVVQEHMQSLLPRLRTEVAGAVQRAVAEAMAQELAHRPAGSRS